MALTFFFRDMQILDLIIRHVVPCVAGSSRVRVWDAGCAMGQEAYSLAILFAENMGPFAFKNLQIHATDKEESNNFGEIIRSGIYPEEAVKRIPAGLLQKYFSPVSQNSHFQVIDSVRSKIYY